MNTELLLAEFKTILAHEEHAKNFYEHYASQVDDEHIKKQLTSVRNEEMCHIKLAKELVGLVK